MDGCCLFFTPIIPYYDPAPKTSLFKTLKENEVEKERQQPQKITSWQDENIDMHRIFLVVTFEPCIFLSFFFL